MGIDHYIIPTDISHFYAAIDVRSIYGIRGYYLLWTAQGHDLWCRNLCLVNRCLQIVNLRCRNLCHVNRCLQIVILWCPGQCLYVVQCWTCELVSIWRQNLCPVSQSVRTLYIRCLNQLRILSPMFSTRKLSKTPKSIFEGNVWNYRSAVRQICNHQCSPKIMFQRLYFNRGDERLVLFITKVSSHTNSACSMLFPG